MIKIKAAAKMNVSSAGLNISNGVISSGEKTMTYSEVAKDVAEWEIPDTPILESI